MVVAPLHNSKFLYFGKYFIRNFYINYKFSEFFFPSSNTSTITTFVGPATVKAFSSSPYFMKQFYSSYFVAHPFSSFLSEPSVAFPKPLRYSFRQPGFALPYAVSISPGLDFSLCFFSHEAYIDTFKFFGLWSNTYASSDLLNLLFFSINIASRRSSMTFSSLLFNDYYQPAFKVKPTSA